MGDGIGVREGGQVLTARTQPIATWLMALALAMSPAYVVHPHLGKLPTSLLELVLLLALVVGFVAFWHELPWRNPYTWPAALLLVAATISVFAAPDLRAAAGIWKAYFIEPALAGLVIAAMARRRDRARLLLLGLGVAGSVIAIANILRAGLAVFAYHDYNTVTPPVWIYNSGNAIPLYLEPLFAFALALLFFSDDRREQVLAGAFAVLAALAVFVSFSRAGWLTLGVLVLLMALLTRWRWIVAGAAVLVGGALFAGSHSVRHRILVEFDFSSKDNTVALRWQLWRSTWNMLTHHPIFGAGLSGFKQVLDGYRVPEYRENLIYPHNLVLNFWSETGLLGLAAILWLLVQVGRVAARGLRVAGQPWVRALTLGMIGMLVAIVLHGMVDVPYFKNDQALAFWALIALQLGALLAAESARPDAASQPGRDVRI
jgi:O-antigen ligase